MDRDVFVLSLSSLSLIPFREEMRVLQKELLGVV